MPKRPHSPSATTADDEETGIDLGEDLVVLETPRTAFTPSPRRQRLQRGASELVDLTAEYTLESASPIVVASSDGVPSTHSVNNHSPRPFSSVTSDIRTGNRQRRREFGRNIPVPHSRRYAMILESPNNRFTITSTPESLLPRRTHFIEHDDESREIEDHGSMALEPVGNSMSPGAAVNNTDEEYARMLQLQEMSWAYLGVPEINAHEFYDDTIQTDHDEEEEEVLQPRNRREGQVAFGLMHHIFQNGFSDSVSYEEDPALDTSYEGLLRLGEIIGEVKQRGLSEALLARLESVRYKVIMQKVLDKLDDTCSVCLTIFGAADLVTKLPTCSHLFHSKCAREWLAVKDTCPICRVQVQCVFEE